MSASSNTQLHRGPTEIAQFPLNKKTAVSSTVQKAVSPADTPAVGWSLPNSPFSSLFLKSLVQKDLIRIQFLFLPYCSFYFHRQIGLIYKKETNKTLHLEHSLCGAETWTLRKIDQKHLEVFDMWSWSGMGAISCNDRVRNYEVSHTVNAKRYILYAIKRRLTGLVTSSLLKER